MMIYTAICLHLLTFFQGCHPALEFNFQPLSMNTLKIGKISPKLEQMKKIDVEPLKIDVKYNSQLLEFIFHDLNFDYVKYVPDYKRLMFTMPDI